MPILIFILLVVLVLQVGFWDTLGAILSAAALMVILVLLVAAIIAASVIWAMNRARR